MRKGNEVGEKEEEELEKETGRRERR